MISPADLNNTIKELNIKGLTVKQFSSTYHNEFEISMPGFEFTLKSGFDCGIVRFQRYRTASTTAANLDTRWEEIFPVLKTFLKEKNPLVGAYYTVLGDSSRTLYEPFLIKLGFEKVAEYPNLQHGPDYYQRMYVLNMSNWDKIHNK